MPVPVAATSRVLRNGIPVTDWSADRQSVELNTSIQSSSFVSLGLLTIAIGILSASLSHDRLNPYFPAAEHFFGDPLDPYFRKQIRPTVDLNWDWNPQIIHGTLASDAEPKKVEEQGTWASACPDGECTHRPVRGETTDAAIEWKKDWDKRLRAACDKRPESQEVLPAEKLSNELHFAASDARPEAIRFFHESHPLMSTAYVLPWRQLRNSSDILPSLTRPPSFQYPNHHPESVSWSKTDKTIPALTDAEPDHELDHGRVLSDKPMPHPSATINVRRSSDFRQASPDVVIPILHWDPDEGRIDPSRPSVVSEQWQQPTISPKDYFVSSGFTKIRCKVCGVLNQSKKNIEQDAFLCTFSIVTVNQKTLLCNRRQCKRTRAINGEYDAEKLRHAGNSLDPTEEQLARWRKRYTKTGKDGKTTFKKVIPPRFQSTQHDSAFRKNTDFDSVIAIYREDSEGKLAKIEESFFEEGNDIRDLAEEMSWLAEAPPTSIDLALETDETTETQEMIQSNIDQLKRRVEESTARTQAIVAAYEDDSRLTDEELKRKYSLSGEMKIKRIKRYFVDKPILERMTSEAVPLTPIIVNRAGKTVRVPILIAAPLHIKKTNQDEWEARLARASQKEFEARCLRDDVEFESWRREAERQQRWQISYRFKAGTWQTAEGSDRRRYDDATWHDLLTGNKTLAIPPTPPPSWERKRHSYKPEVEGLKLGKGSGSVIHPDSWFDHVFDGPRSKDGQLNKKAAEAVAGEKSKKTRARFQMTTEIIFNPSARAAAAKKKGIKEKSMQRAEQRAKKEIEQYRQNGARLFRAANLSQKDLYIILEHGGSFIVLPGDKKDAIEMHRVDVQPRSASFQGLLDGMQGYKFEDEWLGGLRMDLYRAGVQEINNKNLVTSKRNRALKGLQHRLDTKFAKAEVIHFGDPESLRERIGNQALLKKDDESL